MQPAHPTISPYHQSATTVLLLTLPQDLAAYWQFNDPEQNGVYRETLTARDASGRGNHLHLVTLPGASTQTIERVGFKQDWSVPCSGGGCWCWLRGGLRMGQVERGGPRPAAQAGMPACMPACRAMLFGSLRLLLSLKSVPCCLTTVLLPCRAANALKQAP